MNAEQDKNQERELYGFGQNDFGELGLGDTVERWNPALSDSCRGKDIVQVAAGNEYTAVLTNTGEVYCCGYNDEGQCGVAETGGEVPDMVPFFSKVALEEPSFRPGGRGVAVHAYNGCEHLVVVTEGGGMQTCGCNSAGQLGQGDTYEGYSLPRPVGHLSGYKVVKVACSYFHTAVVTEDDRVWTFGANDHGQLGHGDKTGRPTPTPVLSLRGLSALSVACGLHHTVVSVAGGGTLYAFGKNDHGQLGLEGGLSRYTPERLQVFTTDIKQLACGYFHTVALTASGEVHAFGRNDFGQLGLGHRESTWRATRVVGLVGKEIVQVACGCYHTVSLDIDGRVYPFGRNNHGQLGTGTKEDSCRPCFVEKLSDKFVCQVAAGFYHTLCLTGPAVSGSGGGLRAAKSLSSDLYRLLNNPARSDVTFEVEGKLVYGHRCILGARCEPLERMLDGPMKEASSGGGSIPLPNHRHASFLAFLEFLYTDKVAALGGDVLDLEFALDLLDVADQYLVVELQDLCENVMLKRITAENASELFMTADARGASSFRQRCLEFIARNSGTVSNTKGYASLTSELRAEVDSAASGATGRKAKVSRSNNSEPVERVG